MEPTLTVSPDEKKVEVPRTAIVACPLVRFDLRPVADCDRCPHFAGLEDRFPGADELRFDRRYSVRCYGEAARRTIVNLSEPS